MAALEVTACRSCKARVIWATTGGGKPIPLDADPVADGNVRLDNGVALILAADVDLPAGVARYLPHFVTCPDAPAWRRRS